MNFIKVRHGKIPKEKGKLKEIIKEERKGIASRIKEYYGYIVKWVERGGELTYRLINVSSDINNIKDKSKSDPDLCGEFIVKDIEDNPNGKMIEEIINDFRKYRKYPFILDEDIIYNSIRTLHRDKRLIIQDYYEGEEATRDFEELILKSFWEFYDILSKDHGYIRTEAGYVFPYLKKERENSSRFLAAKDMGKWITLMLKT